MSVLLPLPLAPITQTISPRCTENEMPSIATCLLRNRQTRSCTSERANNVALLFEKALGEIATQHLPGVDADGVAIGKRREAWACAGREAPTSARSKATPARLQPTTLGMRPPATIEWAVL